MKQNIKRNLFLSAMALTLMNLFMNCGGFETSGSSIAPGTTILSKAESQNYTVQSSEQLARSMASVTGVEYNSAILNEYNARKPLLSSDYTLESVTAPMLIAISNISSQFCNELLRKETPLDAEDRSFFANVNFGSGLNELTDSNYNAVLDIMSMKFWGRDLTAEERTIFNDTKNEFIQAIPEAGRNATAQTRNLMLSTCTVMLSSFDFITI